MSMSRVISDNRDLTGLSFLWLTLCTSLVWKHSELLLVFFSFLASFGLAIFIMFINSMHRRIKAQTVSSNNRKIRAQVGLLASVVALWGLCIGNSNSSNRIMNMFGAIVNTESSPEHTALCIMAGYLAFDHWYSAIYCQPPPKKIMAVTEDALTLAGILVILVVCLGGNKTAENWTGSVSSWIVYKVLRLLVAFELEVPLQGRPSPLYPLQKRTETPCSATKVAPKTDSPVDQSKLWQIRGVSYNLKDYLETHPGGREAILLGRGRDCTALFESYHPFTTNHRKVLEKYRVMDTATPAVEGDAFYQLLCARVERSLRDKGIDPLTGRAATWLRSSYYMAVLTGIGITATMHAKGSILGSFLLAVFGWWMGALGHDAGHFAASRNASLNDIGLLGISLLCNPIMWQHQHTYAHHSYTNSFEHDPDVHHFEALLRVHRGFQQKDQYKLQKSKFFVAFAYMFVCFGTCVWIPLGMLREGALYGMVEWTDRRRPIRAMGLMLHWILYVGFIMILPFFVHEHWWSAWAASTLHIATTGLIFAMFSQINHLNEASVTLTKHTKPILKDSWAVAQIETSNNFSPHSALWHFLSNGLNLQIEHHLFPGLNHCHLPYIQETVRNTCQEFGVGYKSYDSWNAIMNATLEWLDKLALEGPTSTMVGERDL